MLIPQNMKTLTITIMDNAEVTRRAIAAMNGEVQGEIVAFNSAEELFDTLGCGRWALLHALLESDKLSVRELSKKLGREVKAVHRDATKLRDAGIIEAGEDGRGLFCAFDKVHVDATAARLVA
ncbi:HTH domain-containing protein [Iodobacter sp. CM08]|uniref:HVO_A0114 family putative DNA-binding protein n=1 Tax=Iodobacter sp. CM08 TaxID=3085902 RepID=UPI0029818F20|nr:HTH domain-containing protein [Iodobacter sp. CM08]MDW5416813.1 HTH domain-containing protein [Iodobacter sp. CM08]